MSPLVSGLVFAPLGIGFAAASLAGRKLGALVPGAVVMAASLSGVVLISVMVSAAHQVGWLVPMLALSGIGQGLVAAPLIGRILARVAPADGGAASGILLTATQIANASGVALIGGLFAAVLGATPGTSGIGFTSYAHATAVTATAVLALAALTGVLARMTTR